MKVLILHHFENIWHKGLDSYNTSFEECAEKILDHISKNSYDKIILVRFEEYQIGEEHYYSGVAEHITDVETYGYGWDFEELMYSDPGGKGTDWDDGNIHSEAVLIPDWMKRLDGSEVFIAGAFYGECVDDLECALDHLNINNSQIPGLVVGDNLDYWKLTTIDKKINTKPLTNNHNQL